MANPIDTPQVILGLDSGGVFQDFESRRRQGDSYLSDWYAGASKKGNIWLSTIENNDVISFSHKFNSDSPNDQSLFVFEILDPTNTFESRFFNMFYEGHKSYEEVMEDYALDIFSDKDVDTQVKNTGNKLAGLPFSTPLYVTFGMGNNLAGWSPAMKATLVTLEYGLTDEGLKKLILRFVPNPGASRLNNSKGIEEYLKSTDKTKISWSEPVIAVDPISRDGEAAFKFESNEFPRHHPSPPLVPTIEDLLQPDVQTTGLDVPVGTGTVLKPNAGTVYFRNPVDITFSLFKNVMRATTKSSVIFLLDQLKKPLRARWNSLVISSARQHMQSLQSIKAVGKINPGHEKELIEKHLKDVLIPNIQHGEVSDAATATGVEVADIGQEEWQEKVNKEKSQRAMHRTDKGVEAGSRKGLTGGTTYNDFMSNLRKTPRQDDDMNFWAGVFGWAKDVPTHTQKKFTDFWNATKLNPNWERNELSRAQFSGELQFWYENYYLQSPEGQNLIHQRTMSTPAKFDVHWQDPNKMYQQFLKDKNSEKWKKGPLRFREGFEGPETREEMNARHKKEKESWPTHIRLEDKDIFSIFLTAFENFFDTLGLNTGYYRGDALTTKGGIPVGDLTLGALTEASDPRKLQEDQMKKPRFVEIKVETAQELKQKLKDMINGLDVGPTARLMVHSLSELSLLKILAETVGDDTIIPRGEDEDGSLKTKEILFVTTTRVMASLVNDTGLDTEIETLMGPLYTSIKNGYKIFNDGEPSIHSNEDIPFSQLFDNPDMEELRLDTDNILTLFSNDKKLKFDDTSKLNKYLLDHNIPVFNYGFKNSNILNFNFDLKIWYAHLLNILPKVAMMGAKIPSVKDVDANKSLLKFWKGEKAGEAFTKSVGDFYDKYISDPNSEEFKEIKGAWAKSLILPFSYFDRERYINAMTKVFKASMANLNNPDYLLINPENQDTSMELLLSIRRQMASKLFTAKITTLPFFSFISLGKVLGKTALLYFIEPEVIASVGSKDKRARSTWLSGSYLIVGYDVTMSNSRLTTSFNLMKQ